MRGAKRCATVKATIEQVTIVPLPAAVWGGLALMGVVIVRRRLARAQA
jgi:hypothetical protein